MIKRTRIISDAAWENVLPQMPQILTDFFNILRTHIRVDLRNLWETPAHPVINMDISDAAWENVLPQMPQIFTDAAWEDFLPQMPRILTDFFFDYGFIWVYWGCAIEIFRNLISLMSSNQCKPRRLWRLAVAPQPTIAEQPVSAVSRGDTYLSETHCKLRRSAAVG